MTKEKPILPWIVGSVALLAVLAIISPETLGAAVGLAAGSAITVGAVVFTGFLVGTPFALIASAFLRH